MTDRDNYRVFAPGRIGRLTLQNRFVRSATWDPMMLQARAVTEPVLTLYRRLAAGGVGLIITGDFSVLPAGIFDGGAISLHHASYADVRIDGFDRLAHQVHHVAPACKIVAQISADYPHGDFPILIKMNGTDYLKGGIDVTNLPELARELAQAGIDAIEISGGMWECLVRGEEELGFPPVPAPESHTRIRRAARQSYFREYAAALDVDVPIILVGGNRDIERLETIVRQGTADFVALCRPLIREPNLPVRWRSGLGSSSAECISCNTCLYDMWTHVERGKPWVARCLVKEDLGRVKDAQRWLASWVENNVAAEDEPPSPAATSLGNT